MKNLRVVHTGCGSMSAAWLGSAAHIAGLEIVGLVDLDEKRAAARRDQFQLATAELDTDLTRLLRRLQPDIVFDCTVPQAHATVTLTALRHGCHVLGEKPLAPSLTEARRMVAAARRTRRLYAVTQNYRYRPEIAALRRFLARGRLGRVTTVCTEFFRNPHFGGFREEMDHVLLVDMAIHHFDMARFLTGADPVSVQAQDWNPAGSWFRHGASASATFQMSNGLVFGYRGSWCANGLSTSWNARWRIIGERGSVTWDGENVFAAEVAVPSKKFQPENKALAVKPVRLAHTGHDAILREFATCVRRGTTPQTICTDNIKSLAMVLAAVDSAEKKRQVAVRW
jgi:predicted dehydrogenase